MPFLKTYGRVYTAHTDVSEREKYWLSNLESEIKIKSTFENNLLINCTWLNAEEDNLYKILDLYDPKDTKIWLSASIDGIQWMYKGKFHNTIIAKSFTHSFVGFGPNHWHSWMPKWIYENNKNVNVTLYKNFKYNFLSYNRKPKLHRHELVSKIIKNNLLEKSWVTYNAGVFSEIDKISGNTDQYLLNEDKRFSRPEDLTSLGNLDIWNNAFCVVVTETEYQDPWHITEKTWKPIMGLRPFIVIGHKNLQSILTEQGFYNSNDLFGIKYSNIDDAINLLLDLKNKTHDEIYNLYLNMLPKLEHNKKRFIELSHKANIL